MHGVNLKVMEQFYGEMNESSIEVLICFQFLLFYLIIKCHENAKKAADNDSATVHLYGKFMRCICPNDKESYRTCNGYVG